MNKRSLHLYYIAEWCGFTGDVILGPSFYKMYTSEGPQMNSRRVLVTLIFIDSILFSPYENIGV